MRERSEIEQLLRDLYTARMRGDLDALCQILSSDAAFQISGASQTSPIVTTAVGVEKYRPLLALMIKTFKLSNEVIVSMIIDDTKAAVHWRVDVRSKISGVTVPTELVDLVEVRDGRIASYIEFFVPR